VTKTTREACMRKMLMLLCLILFVFPASGASAAVVVGTTFPPGFPTIMDSSLRVPVIGFGGAGPITRTPVIFLHGNNDTPYPTTCNGAYGAIHGFAQYLADHGYAASELWGLGYQGEQCDIVTYPPNRSGVGHSTVANIPDLRAFVHAVLSYTGATQVDVVGHSLGVTLTREWLRQDNAYGLVRSLVGVDGPNHGIINCSPNAANFWQLPALGGFNPDSEICKEYGSDHTPLLTALNAGDETPGATRYLTIVNTDKSFVYFDKQDGVLPPVPAEDRDGNPHDFSASALLAGATSVGVTGQGVYDPYLGTTHLGIINSPAVWAIGYGFLVGGGA
jgi:pimeloyl-ACP methyl ester carboxylesterase